MTKVSLPVHRRVSQFVSENTQQHSNEATLQHTATHTHLGIHNKRLPARKLAGLPVRERKDIGEGPVPRIGVHTLFASVDIVREPWLSNRVAP